MADILRVTSRTRISADLDHDAIERAQEENQALVDQYLKDDELIFARLLEIRREVQCLVAL